MAASDGEVTPWLTVRQAAARAQCGRGAIYTAVQQEKLRAVKVGQALRFHVEWIDAWLDSQATRVINPAAPGPAHVFERR